MNTQDTLHPFEVAGLGLSPFRFGGIRENVYSACPGHQQAGGTCDYCGQGIRYECVIYSHDGKQFVVGMDCVNKLGRSDNRLVEAVHRERLNIEQAKRQEEREAKWAARQAKYEAELDRQRQVNGGLTDHEVQKAAEKASKESERSKWSTENDWLIRVIEREPGGFAESMVEKLELGPINGLTQRMIQVLKDMYAKSHGRRGSKKYEAAVAEFESRAGIAE